MDGLDLTEDLFGILYPEHESEREFIAAVCWSDDAANLLWRINLEPMHFTRTEYARIFEVMLDLRNRKQVVDQVSIAEELTRGSFDRDCEIAMWEATGQRFDVGQAEFYAEQILNKWRRHNIGVLGESLTAISRDSPLSELDEEVDRSIENLIATGASEPELHTTDQTLAATLFEERPPFLGFPSPWPSLNRSIQGFRPGSLYVLAADTGYGKSSVALQVAASLAQHGTVLYSTMEMGAKEMQYRLTAQQCGVTLAHVERGYFPEASIRERVQRFAETRVPIVFDTRSAVSHTDIRRTALGITGHLSGIVIDYLQLMNLQRVSGENLTDAIGRTTKALKNLARDMDVPILLLSQLNREASRAGQPSRHHLLASGAIANDSDVILLLHREDRANEHDLMVIIDKNRQGPEGELWLTWEGEFVRAVDTYAS